MGPCKIWAPYVGHCVEKSLWPKSKYVDIPKPGSINCLGRTILMCRSFETVFSFFMVRKGFKPKSGAKSEFFGGSRTALSKFAKSFLVQILW